MFLLLIDALSEKKRPNKQKIKPKLTKAKTQTKACVTAYKYSVNVRHLTKFKHSRLRMLFSIYL
jgi:hypothetical protein